MRKLTKFIIPKILPALVLVLGLQCLVAYLTASSWYVWLPCFIMVVFTIGIPVLEYWETIFNEVIDTNDSNQA